MPLVDQYGQAAIGGRALSGGDGPRQAVLDDGNGRAVVWLSRQAATGPVGELAQPGHVEDTHRSGGSGGQQQGDRRVVRGGSQFLQPVAVQGPGRGCQLGAEVGFFVGAGPGAFLPQVPLDLAAKLEDQRTQWTVVDGHGALR